MKKPLISVARKLRKTQTPWDRKLWLMLRHKDFKNLKFRRQYTIGNYIVDFCCPEKKLVIELDGGGHSNPSQRDIDVQRDTFLRSQGSIVLRIWNDELNKNTAGVFDRINELVN